VILIDGDMLVYRVGFACDEEPEKIAIQTMANYISEIISDLSEHYNDTSETRLLFLSLTRVAVQHVNQCIKTYSVSTCSMHGKRNSLTTWKLMTV
jgi:hypothetical protein